MKPELKVAHEFVLKMRGRLPESISEGDLPMLNPALQFLFADLRDASRRFCEPGDNGRPGAIAALGAFVRFIQLFKGPLAENLEVPSLRLQDALVGLDGNIVDPLLKPASRRGRSGSSGARAAVMGAAAGTVRRLRKVGIGREDAYTRVANQLTKIGIRPERGSGPVTARTVRGWCNKVEQDVARTGVAATVFDLMFTADENKWFAALRKDRAPAFVLKSLARYVQTLALTR
jgi:hypothetical protein